MLISYYSFCMLNLFWTLFNSYRSPSSSLSFYKTASLDFLSFSVMSKWWPLILFNLSCISSPSYFLTLLSSLARANSSWSLALYSVSRLLSSMSPSSTRFKSSPRAARCVICSRTAWISASLSFNFDSLPSSCLLSYVLSPWLVPTMDYWSDICFCRSLIIWRFLLDFSL